MELASEWTKWNTSLLMTFSHDATPNLDIVFFSGLLSYELQWIRLKANAHIHSCTCCVSFFFSCFNQSFLMIYDNNNRNVEIKRNQITLISNWMHKNVSLNEIPKFPHWSSSLRVDFFFFLSFKFITKNFKFNFKIINSFIENWNWKWCKKKGSTGPHGKSKSILDN